MQIDDAQYINVVMRIHKLIKYSDNYLKTSGILFQHCSYAPVIYDNGDAIDFTEANVTDSLNFKKTLTSQTRDNDTKNIEIMVPLKYLRNFLENSWNVSH